MGYNVGGGGTVIQVDTGLRQKVEDINSQLEQKVTLGDLYDIRASRRYGREILNASDLVSLVVGEEPTNDNTSALEALLARPNRDKEIIKFPPGVIYTDRIYLTDDIYWIGDDKEPTIIKLRPQTDKIHYALVNIIGASNGSLENITFDANKDAHTNVTGDSEGISWNLNAHSWLLWEVNVKNTIADAYDHDNSYNNIHVFCTAENTQKDGFHNSTNSENNWYYYCQAFNINGGRGGFTSTENSKGGNKFVNCVANNCRSRGFEIKKTIDGIANNLSYNNISLNNGEGDTVEGISKGTPPSYNDAYGFRGKTWTLDFNDPPRKSGVFAVGAGSINMPITASGGMLIQALNGAGTIEQLFIPITNGALKSFYYRDSTAQTWSSGDFYGRTFSGNVNDLFLNGNFYVSSSAQNTPNSDSGTLVTSSNTAKSATGGQLFISSLKDAVYIRRSSTGSWSEFYFNGKTWGAELDFNNPPRNIAPTIIYCTTSALNKPVNKDGTLSYSVTGAGLIKGMSFITSDGEMYIRGDTSSGWKKVTTTDI